MSETGFESFSGTDSRNRYPVWNGSFQDARSERDSARLIGRRAKVHGVYAAKGGVLEFTLARIFRGIWKRASAVWPWNQLRFSF
jgi:hypothetical protein